MQNSDVKIILPSNYAIAASSDGNIVAAPIVEEPAEEQVQEEIPPPYFNEQPEQPEEEQQPPVPPTKDIDPSLYWLYSFFSKYRCPLKRTLKFLRWFQTIFSIVIIVIQCFFLNGFMFGVSIPSLIFTGFILRRIILNTESRSSFWRFSVSLIDFILAAAWLGTAFKFFPYGNYIVGFMTSKTKTKLGLDQFCCVIQFIAFFTSCIISYWSFYMVYRENSFRDFQMGTTTEAKEYTIRIGG